MSKLIRYKDLVIDKIHAHCETIISQVTESADFKELCERADEMGIDISVSIRNTYTDEKVAEYVLPSVYDDIPYGYEADICFDLVRGDRLLFCPTEEGEAEQMSLSYIVVTTPDTMFARKLRLLEYDEIIGLENVCAVLGEFLDRAENTEFMTSIVMENSTYPDEADKPFDMMTCRAELPECKCVEIAAGEFDGKADNENSVFFTESAFMPYLYLLESRKFGFFREHGISGIDSEMWEQFCSDAEELCIAIKKEPDFTDALCSLGMYSIEPVPRAEVLLEEVTFWRKKEFTEQTKLFIEWGNKAIAESGNITVFWE